MINDKSIKFIIDSGSPETLIPNCQFNGTTEVEPLITTYKHVNNQRIEITRQTNNKTQQNARITTAINKSNNINVDVIRLDATVRNTSQHR